MSYKLSLIIPCYNATKHIDNLFKSLTRETIFNDMEIILINDASTDNTLRKLEVYKQKYKNVYVYSNPENLGTYDSRRNGLSKSKCKFICFMDADDTTDPTYHEELFNTIISSGSPIVSTLHVDKLLPNKKRVPAKEIKEVKINHNTLININSADNMTRALMVRVPWIWTCIFNRNALKPYQSLPPSPLIFGEDDVLYYTALITAGRILFINTKSAYLYNQQYETNAIINNEHKRKICSQSFARSHILLDTFLLEYNHMDFYPLITEKRKKIKEYLIKKYMDTFVTETFVNSDGIIRTVYPKQKEKERFEILNMIEFLNKIENAAIPDIVEKI